MKKLLEKSEFFELIKRLILTEDPDAIIVKTGTTMAVTFPEKSCFFNLIYNEIDNSYNNNNNEESAQRVRIDLMIYSGETQMCRNFEMFEFVGLIYAAQITEYGIFKLIFGV